MHSAAEIQMAKAINTVHEKIANREGITDLRANRPNKIDPAANGFLVRVRGLGVIFAVKPGALCKWIPGDVSMIAVIKKIDATGELIHGCDGKRTRQIFIPGWGRFRYYCFKTGEGAQSLPTTATTTRRIWPVATSQSTCRRHTTFDWNDDD